MCDFNNIIPCTHLRAYTRTHLPSSSLPCPVSHSPTTRNRQRTPRAVQVPGCGPWQRLTLEAGVRLVKSMRTFKQMPVPRSSDPAVAAQQNSRTPTHKPIEPGFWGPKTEVSSLGHRKIWERKFVTVSEIQVSFYATFLPHPLFVLGFLSLFHFVRRFPLF